MREGWKRCHLLRENYHSSWIDHYRILNIVDSLLDSDDGKRITLIPPAILNPAMIHRHCTHDDTDGKHIMSMHQLCTESEQVKMVIIQEIPSLSSKDNSVGQGFS